MNREREWRPILSYISFYAISLFYLLPIKDRKETKGKSVGCAGFG